MKFRVALQYDSCANLFAPFGLCAVWPLLRRSEWLSVDYSCVGLPEGRLQSARFAAVQHGKVGRC